MTVGQLRERYLQVTGEATQAANRKWLVRRIIWRMQSIDEGGLSERAIARARELASAHVC
jgi:methyl coenzyme M reductase gamma subunit